MSLIDRLRGLRLGAKAIDTLDIGAPQGQEGSDEALPRLYNRLGPDLVRRRGFEIQFLTTVNFKALNREIFRDHAYYFRTAKPDPHILDCGSNIGMSVLYFKKLYPDSTILAFEPDPKAFQCLEHNIDRNQLAGVTCFNVALGTEEGKIPFYTNPADSGDLRIGVVKIDHSWETSARPCVRLSDRIDAPVDCIKIDIEGSELDVLVDLEKREKLKFIDRMIIEYHHHIHSEVDELSKLLSILERSGFGYAFRPWDLGPASMEGMQILMLVVYRKGLDGVDRPPGFVMPELKDFVPES